MPESSHVFSVEPDVFRAVSLGLKRSVVLPIALGVVVADQIVLREWRLETGRYSGDWLCRRITYEERGVRAPMHIRPQGLPERRPETVETPVEFASAVYSFNTASENDSARAYLARKLTRAWGEGLTQEQFWDDEHQKEYARRAILRHAG